MYSSIVCYSHHSPRKYFCPSCYRRHASLEFDRFGYSKGGAPRGTEGHAVQLEAREFTVVRECVRVSTTPTNVLRSMLVLLETDLSNRKLKYANHLLVSSTASDHEAWQAYSSNIKLFFKVRNFYSDFHPIL